MARHFLQLYLLIVVTLVAAGWAQERLWEAYAHQHVAEAPDNQSQAAALAVIEQQLATVPAAGRKQFIADLAARTRLDLELFELRDIAGEETLQRLARGEVASMSTANGRTWLLRRLPEDGRVLAFKFETPSAQRSAFEWALVFLFYGAIALVIMAWLWPLTRDLRRLERATTRFGNRNWAFDPGIKQGSQVNELAQAFRRMAARIDGLIRSHQDMSNAVSHEIKTPLARMRFEIELARTASTPAKLAEHLANINTDIAELNAFVTATLDYAILDRAEFALNVADNDFTLIVPAVAEAARRSARSDLDIRHDITSDAKRVVCDGHLMETVLRNLLYNAIRYARRKIRVSFGEQGGWYVLRVDDDGPGIPEAQRERVFGSFVQLGERGGARVGYGLGLAIVRRVAEWHGGDVAVDKSTLGGARFCFRWPVNLETRPSSPP